MKALRYAAFLTFIAGPLLGRAQQLTPPVAEDTVGHVEGGYGMAVNRFYLGTLTKTDGTQVYAYMPYGHAGYEKRINYFTPPLSFDNQLRHRHGVKVKDIKSMTVHGRTFKPIELPGKKPSVLALHLLEGPIALATYAEPRAIPIPIPLVVGLPMPIVNLNISDKNHWYLYRNGVWTEIRRAGFAETMSAYLFDNPELAGKVARQEPNYLHRDTPAIITEYNRAKTAGSK